MADLFDPNAPQAAIPDFAAQSNTIATQKRIADALRKQQQSTKQPEGQMISGHYVAPSWTQYLSPMLTQYDTGQAEKTLGKSEADMAKQVGEAKTAWQKGLPQATAAQTIPGTIEGLGGREHMGADTVVPGKQPTYGDISKATMAGIAIPGNEEAAKVYNQGAMGELTRQETREQQDKMAAAAAQQHKEKLEADMDIKRAQLARDLQRDDLSHEDKMALIRAHSGDIAAMAASHVKVAEIAADAKKNAAKPQALGATQQTAHVGNRDMIKSIDNAIELLRQNPGAVGGTKGLQGDWVRTKTSTPDEVRAQAALTNVQSGKIHERSGAATSVHENKILQPFLPQLGNDYESNMSKLVGLKNAAEQNNQSIEEFARENNRVVPGDTKLTTYDPEAYKPYSAEEMKVKRPPKSALPQAVGATAPAAAKPVTKVIDGVTYVQTGPQKWAPQ